MSAKAIEDNIRKRFLEVVDQLNATDEALNIEKIMVSVDDYPQAYTQMKTGKRYPTLKNVVLLCQTYSINANWLLFGIGESGIETLQAPLKRLALIEQEVQILKMILRKKKRKA